MCVQVRMLDIKALCGRTNQLHFLIADDSINTNQLFDNWCFSLNQTTNSYITDYHAVYTLLKRCIKACMAAFLNVFLNVML